MSDANQLGAAIQKTGEVMVSVGTKLQGASPDVGALAEELTDATKTLTAVLPKTEEEVEEEGAGEEAAKATGENLEEEGKPKIEDAVDEEAKAKRLASLPEKPDDKKFTAATTKYVNEGGVMPNVGDLFENKQQMGGKRKKRRGGKSQRAWKKNKKGGRQSKKRR